MVTRSWTRLHEHLGVPPGPLDFDMVAKATADRLAESDDLDWKEHLPEPPREGRWNELAKDVAAMANTRGGLIIFGVQDTTCELTGIDPAAVKPEQYAQWIRNHVHPYLSGLTFTTLTSPDRTHSVLVADVPASPMAPHLVYGTAARDKDQQAAVAPYRDRDHTAWMAEHQLERAYRDRFTRAAQTDDTLRQLVDHTRQTVTLQQREASAWFIAVARPERPLPRSATRTPRDSARFVTAQAHDRAAQHPDSRLNPAALASLAGVSNPRPGLRRWVLSTLGLRAGRETYAELHDDGTVVLAANLTFRTSRDHFRDDDHPPAGLFVHQDTLDACCRDLCILTSQLARHLRLDSSLLLHATVTTGLHKAVPRRVWSRFCAATGLPELEGSRGALVALVTDALTGLRERRWCSPASATPTAIRNPLVAAEVTTGFRRGRIADLPVAAAWPLSPGWDEGVGDGRYGRYGRGRGRGTGRSVACASADRYLLGPGPVDLVARRAVGVTEGVFGGCVRCRVSGRGLMPSAWHRRSVFMAPGVSYRPAPGRHSGGQAP